MNDLHYHISISKCVRNPHNKKCHKTHKSQVNNPITKHLFGFVIGIFYCHLLSTLFLLFFWHFGRVYILYPQLFGVAIHVCLCSRSHIFKPHTRILSYPQKFFVQVLFSDIFITNVLYYSRVVSNRSLIIMIDHSLIVSSFELVRNGIDRHKQIPTCNQSYASFH